jgi:hypothetical protein
VVKDYTVLVNLVAVAGTVLPGQPIGLLAPRLPHLWSQLGAWSARHPDVSSFYRLADILLELALRSGQLDDKTSSSSSCRSQIVSFLQDLLQRVKTFRQAVLRIRNVYSGSRIQVFSIPDLGSASNYLSILTQKMVSKLYNIIILVVHPGSGS